MKTIVRGTYARVGGQRPGPDSDVIQVDFSYNPQAPYSVCLTFRIPGEDVVWEFARDLLRQGVDTPTGLADVRVAPGWGAMTCITLQPPEGTETFHILTEAVLAFLAATYEAVPDGSEEVDIDAAIDRLLGATP